MKKLIALILSLSACLAFGACNEFMGLFEPSVSSSSIEESTDTASESTSEEEQAQVTVTFKQNGQEDIVKTLDKGSTLTEIPMPAEKVGYTVTWEEVNLDNIAEDIVVNAVETANIYTVTYDANGGTLSETTQDVVFDEETTLATPVREDYIFNGWTYEGVAVVDGSKWTIASDATLVAEWIDNRPIYKVTFVDGIQSKEISVKKGESVEMTNIPAFVGKIGYSVAWDKSDFTNVLADFTVTAIYTANTYTVTYDADGFAIDGTTVDLTYDAISSALDMSLTRVDANFLGWKYGDATYTNETVWNVAEDNVILTTSWAMKDEVTVTFKDTDASLVQKTLYQGQDLTDIPTPKDKIGYNVDTENWYLDEECTMVATFESVQENFTVYAKTTAKTYTVNYNANGGSVDGETQTVTFDAEYTLKTPTHPNSYMVFNGWKDDAGNIVALTGVWTTDAGKNLTAEWIDSREMFTITFVQAGQVTKTFNVKEGEDFTNIPTPVAKVGYTIVWDKTEFVNVTENITVTAIETAKTYTVTLNANGGTVSQVTFTVTYGQAYSFVKPLHEELAFVSWTYNGQKVALNGIWNIDLEAGEGELLAEWGGDIWSKNY